MIVVDASVVVSALVDSGPIGQWAEQQLTSDGLAAPHLMPVEVASVLRRSELAGALSADVAALAHADLLDLPVDLVAYEHCALRVWELRHTITSYNAWYVTLAEALDAALVTLDVRLSAASGPTCRFVVPDPV